MRKSRFTMALLPETAVRRCIPLWTLRVLAGSAAALVGVPPFLGEGDDWSTASHARLPWPENGSEPMEPPVLSPSTAPQCRHSLCPCSTTGASALISPRT
jgi:hypothetical protein